jgi:pilus assembly protein Flp/PilA
MRCIFDTPCPAHAPFACAALVGHDTRQFRVGNMPSKDKLIVAVRRAGQGQGLAEYALILALIAIVAIIALIFLGGQVSQILSNVGNSV